MLGHDRHQRKMRFKAFPCKTAKTASAALAWEEEGDVAWARWWLGQRKPEAQAAAMPPCKRLEPYWEARGSGRGLQVIT